MRIRTPLALLAAAALAATGCKTSSGLDAPSVQALSGDVVIWTGEIADRKECEVILGKKAIIEYPAGSSFAEEVTFLRSGEDSGEIQFKLKKPGDKTYFPDFEQDMPSGSSIKKSGKPQNSPPAGYIVGYTIKWKGATCDPDICIRKSGAGCDGYLTQ